MLNKIIFSLSVSVLPQLISSLNNGFTLPAMGYSSWNDCSSFRDNGEDGWCWQAEDHIKNITLYLQSSGLAKLGYSRINVDEVSSKTLSRSRDKDHTIMSSHARRLLCPLNIHRFTLATGSFSSQNTERNNHLCCMLPLLTPPHLQRLPSEKRSATV